MRNVINKQTTVFELVKQINSSTNGKTYYINKDIKVFVRLERFCSICKTWVKNSDMEKLDDVLACWSCCENARRISN